MKSRLFESRTQWSERRFNQIEPDALEAGLDAVLERSSRAVSEKINTLIREKYPPKTTKMRECRT